MDCSLQNKTNESGHPCVNHGRSADAKRNQPMGAGTGIRFLQEATSESYTNRVCKTQIGFLQLMIDSQ